MVFALEHHCPVGLFKHFAYLLFDGYKANGGSFAFWIVLFEMAANTTVKSVEIFITPTAAGPINACQRRIVVVLLVKVINFFVHRHHFGLNCFVVIVGIVALNLSLIHISEPTRRTPISYAV